VPVPGGIAAAAAAIGLNAVPDRARFAAEITRLAYDNAEIPNPQIESWLQAVRANAAAADGAGDDVVPVPLSAAVWSDAVFRERVAPNQLLAAILADRRATLLCHGLTALDDETLGFLAAHPALVRRLYERATSAFSVFSGGLRIVGSRVAAPGSTLLRRGRDAATPLWEAAVGESAARPERFVAALFSRDNGRVAYLYDAIAQLDGAHAAFGLGLWLDNDAVRLERFQLLVRSADDAVHEWHMRTLPFSRPAYDLASLLARVRVRDDGSPAPPASRAMWHRAFDAGARSEPADGRDAGETALVDAAWLAEATSGTLRLRADRLDQLAFAQRTFASARPDQMASVARVVSLFPRYQMLMLTIERVGATDPAMYLQGAQAASRLASLGGRRAFASLGEFQGALALTTRMWRAGSVDAAQRDAALAGLFALPLDGGGYHGAIAGWLAARVLDSDAGLEEAVTARLAGPAADPRTATAIEWEGQRYRLDLAAAERRRLTRIREKQGRPTLDTAVALASLAARASSPDADLAALVAELRKVVPDLPPDRGSDDGTFRYDDRGRTPAEVVERAAETLSISRAPKDRSKAAAAMEPVRDLSDALMAEALLSFAYAIDLGDPDGAVLLAGNPVRRHDFGLTLPEADARARAAWTVPKQEVAPGVPWHVSGSALGLDIGLATLLLRRIDASLVGAAPRLSSNERQTFATTVALMNPYALTDADRDRIAAAIARGRQRVAGFAADQAGFAAAAAEMLLDGERRRAIGWMAKHEPDRVVSMFSLSELLRLGGGADVAALDQWGTASYATAGCACLAMPSPGAWRRLLGRPQLGLLATAVADLNLHVALTLRDLHLPAAIERHVLAAATQDFIDEVEPNSSDDWLTLVRAAQRIGRERIEDYVAAVAADGPLAPIR